MFQSFVGGELDSGYVLRVLVFKKWVVVEKFLLFFRFEDVECLLDLFVEGLLQVKAKGECRFDLGRESGTSNFCCFEGK